MVMWTIWNCESIGNSIATRKEWQNKFLGNRAQLRLETESWKQVLKLQVVRQQLIEQTICYLLHLTPNQVNILSSCNSLAWSDNDKHSWGYVSVRNNCSLILYRQNFEKKNFGQNEKDHLRFFGSEKERTNNGPLGSSNLIIPQDILVCENLLIT